MTMECRIPIKKKISLMIPVIRVKHNLSIQPTFWKKPPGCTIDISQTHQAGSSGRGKADGHKRKVKSSEEGGRDMQVRGDVLSGGFRKA